jgi:hypothetical protein
MTPARDPKQRLFVGSPPPPSEAIKAAQTHTKTVLIHLKTATAFDQYHSRCSMAGTNPVTDKCYDIYCSMANSFAKKHQYKEFSFDEALQTIRQMVFVKQELEDHDVLDVNQGVLVKDELDEDDKLQSPTKKRMLWKSGLIGNSDMSSLSCQDEVEQSTKGEKHKDKGEIHAHGQHFPIFNIAFTFT